MSIWQYAKRNNFCARNHSTVRNDIVIACSVYDKIVINIVNKLVTDVLHLYIF